MLVKHQTSTRVRNAYNCEQRCYTKTNDDGDRPPGLRVQCQTKRHAKTNLQLIQREAAAEADLHVVACRGRVHDRSQQLRRAREDTKRLLLANHTPRHLLTWLVEPCLHTLLPVLVEVGIYNGVVVLHLQSTNDVPKKDSHTNQRSEQGKGDPATTNHQDHTKEARQKNRKRRKGCSPQLGPKTTHPC